MTRIGRLISGCAALALAVSAAAAQPAAVPAVPPPASAFFAYPQVLDAQLSPDGHRLALSTAYRTGR
ncbi:MAG: hypothetical protein ACK520_13125, partial [Inhella sp.]